MKHLIWILAPLLILAGCSGGNEEPTLELQLIQAGRGIIAEKNAPKPARPVLTRAVLDTLDGAFLEVTRERTDQLAYLYVSAQRNEGAAGRITVWRAEDDATLVLRNGVLIATQGIGGDMLSSTVQVAGATAGPVAGGEKVHYIRADDNKERRLALVCELSDLGPETIVIVEQSHATRHLRETCRGGESGNGPGTVVNDFWVESRRQIVWQSRQWAGPHIGYLRLRQLTN